MAYLIRTRLVLSNGVMSETMTLSPMFKPVLISIVLTELDANAPICLKPASTLMRRPNCKTSILSPPRLPSIVSTPSNNVADTGLVPAALAVIFAPGSIDLHVIRGLKLPEH